MTTDDKLDVIIDELRRLNTLLNKAITVIGACSIGGATIDMRKAFENVEQISAQAARIKRT